MQRLRALGVLTVALVGLAHFSNSAEAGSHSWRVSEVFSNADGTIQFIELKECCGLAGENGIHTHPVRSLTNEFPFPAPLNQGSTANKHLLLGTAAFAALPGAPPHRASRFLLTRPVWGVGRQPSTPPQRL